MKKRYIVLLLIIVVIAAGVIFAVNKFGSVEANLEQLKTMEITDVDLSKVEDGVYKGSYEMFPVAVEVKVTVMDHKISDIELVKHQNGQGSGAEVLPDMIVEKQTLQLDAVSGATFSSKVILKAVENALVNASK